MTDPSETLWDRPIWLEGWRLISREQSGLESRRCLRWGKEQRVTEND